MTRQIQTFEVSLKAFIVHAGKALLVQEADTGFWELPGGRIDVGEEWLDHAAILAREIAEELGSDCVVAPSLHAITWVRQRPTDGVYQFLVARRCRLVSGQPKLSDEHAALAWHTPDTWAKLMFPPQSGYADGLSRLWALPS
jgi:8-oxo-dGTP pyrophosphatase MutT (NUDIX family)